MALTQIETGMIKDAAVTDAKIAAVAASKVTGQLADANMSPGSIIQVVSISKSDVASVSTTSQTDIPGLSVAITPLSTSSKILAIVSVPTYHSAAMEGGILLKRNGSILVVSTDFYHPSGTGVSGNINIAYVDSPASSSAVTYNLAFRIYGSGTLSINKDYDGNVNGVSTLTLLEIAA